jgi:uncharacterized protein YdeI (YjbR/CyaY-like superfamily)
MSREHPPGDAQSEKQKLDVPADLITALSKNKKALAVFQKLPPSHKKEYVKWINEAKKEDTRLRRIEKMIAGF